MTNEEVELGLEWVRESKNTNDYCERSILIDALISLENNPPNIKKACQRLRQLIPLGKSYHLVDPPEFLGNNV